jgi:hypothetical protein
VTRRAGIVMAMVLLVGATWAMRTGGGRGPSGQPALLHVEGRSVVGMSMAAYGSSVAVVWGARDEAGATDVYLAMSDDGGRAFGAPVRVNDTHGTARLGGELPPRAQGAVATRLKNPMACAVNVTS